MTCEEIRDLIPGYVLNALEPSEMDRVDEHLLTCREHDEELVDLRATGMSLALLDEAAQPSPHLRDRVRAAAGPTSVPLALRAALEANDDDFDDEFDDMDLEPQRRGWSAASRRLAPWWFGGAAAVIAVARFGAGWFAGTRSTPAPVVQQTIRYSYEMRGASGELVRFAGVEGNDRVTVTMDGIGAQPEGRQYQVWVIRDGKWLSLGHCNTNAKGWWRGDFEFALRRGEEVALTVEPAGGSPKPSTPPVLRTKL